MFVPCFSQELQLPFLINFSSGYVAAISACARGQQWAISLDFLSEALEKRSGIPDAPDDWVRKVCG